MNSNNLEERAKVFAQKAHESIDQRRKYTNEPYINHPAAVVEIVKSVPHTSEMLAAAWLHDVVEDTPVELAEIESKFGKTVSELVEMLTDVSKPEDGNRAFRKSLDKDHTAQASPEAKTIKIADLIHNTESIIKRDPGFARIYLKEKRALLDVLKEGDPTLWAVAHEIAHIKLNT
jgi:(p)ppGpp synthase/HD superfamily hydrolase